MATKTKKDSRLIEADSELEGITTSFEGFSIGSEHTRRSGANTKRKSSAGSSIISIKEVQAAEGSDSLPEVPAGLASSTQPGSVSASTTRKPHPVPQVALRKRLEDLDPGLVASKVRDAERTPLFIGLEVEQSAFDAAKLASWVIRFRERISELAERKGPIPTVAIFTDRTENPDRTILHEAGALVFDRSLQSENGIRTMEQFAAWLTASTSIERQQAATPVQRPINESDRIALTNYPPGITPEMLSGALMSLKQAEEDQQ